MPAWVMAAGLIVGLAVLARPVIADLARMRRNAEAVSSMTAVADDAEDATRLQRLAQARAYNALLGGYEDPWLGGTGEDGDVERPQRDVALPAVTDVLPYEEQLQGDEGTAVGWVEAPKASIRQPVYLGATDANLSAGVAQLEGTSLPVGGQTSRCVLTGHSGLQNDRMFDDIRLLEVGDLFAVHTLGDTYTYEVESVEVVEPEQVATLGMEEGRDLVTLVTCTPYHVNSHRLLVTGHRTTRQIEQQTAVEAVAAYATKPRTLPVLVGCAIAVTTLVVVGVRARRRHARRAGGRGHGTKGAGDVPAPGRSQQA